LNADAQTKDLAPFAYDADSNITARTTRAGATIAHLRHAEPARHQVTALRSGGDLHLGSRRPAHRRQRHDRDHAAGQHDHLRHAYDGLDRLTATIYPNSSAEIEAYDADGDATVPTTVAGFKRANDMSSVTTVIGD
jgi:hypothetical protein